MSSKTPAMNAAGVRSTPLPIGELLRNRSPARVPRYQRPYAWGDDQVADLINDVRLLLPNETGTRGHFYGGMVAIKVTDASEPSSSLYEIVDGQQRLATFCLLLARIALRAEELASAAERQGFQDEAKKLAILAKGIRNEFLYYQRYDIDEGDESSEPLVRLSRADDHIFQALLKGTSVSADRPSHRLLRQAADLLRSELVEPATPESDLPKARKELQRIKDAILRDSFVIHIVGDSRSSGYRLFAVLNDRGARLTIADLLRSHTLEQLDPFENLRDKSASLWDDILARGESVGVVDEFLMAYYTSLTGKRAKRDDLFDEIKVFLFPVSSPPLEIVSALERIDVDLTAFISIREGIWPYALKDRLQRVTEWQRSRLPRLVSTLRHELSMPLLLAARAQCNEEKFAELVHLLEIFAFRYKNVCGAHAGPASAAYYAECKDLRALAPGAAVSLDSLRKTLRSLLSKRASDAVFRNAIKDQLSYDAGSAARANIRHLLTVIEDYRPWIKRGASGHPTPSMVTVTDFNQVTIEHIYPRHSSQPDPSLLPHVNRLGNLSYWAPQDNSNAGSSPFSEKRVEYKASSISLNQELSELPSWDLEALEAREEKLISEACRIFWV